MWSALSGHTPYMKKIYTKTWVLLHFLKQNLVLVENGFPETRKLKFKKRTFEGKNSGYLLELNKIKSPLYIMKVTLAENNNNNTQHVRIHFVKQEIKSRQNQKATQKVTVHSSWSSKLWPI